MIVGEFSIVFYTRIKSIFQSRHFVSLAFVFFGVSCALVLLNVSREYLYSLVQMFGPGILFCITAFCFRIGLMQRLSHRNLEKIFCDQKSSWIVALCIIALIVSVFFLCTTNSTFIDPDEPRFARATVEMVRSGNYLVPTFNGELRPDKPILFYWLMSLPVRLLGHTEPACRFFAPLATGVVCFQIYLLGCQLFNPAAGLLAMIIIATTPLMMLCGTYAITDALLLAFITVSLAIFYRIVTAGFSWPKTLMLGAVLGAAQLTKGPVGLGVPLLAIVTSSWLLRKNIPEVRKYLWPLLVASVLSSMIFLLWAIPANEATNGEFLRRGMGYHVVERMFSPIERPGQNYLLFLPYYFTIVACYFFPWTLFLPGALSAIVAGRLGNEKIQAFLLGWIVPTFILMSLVATKLPHYLLPIWPALALLTAGTLTSTEKQKLHPRDELWIRRGLWFFLPIGAGLALFLMAGPRWLLPVPGIRVAFFTQGFLILVMTGMVLIEHRARRFMTVAVILAVGMTILQVNNWFFVLPKLEQFKLSPPIARAIKEHTSSLVPVATYSYTKPSLHFYLDRQPIQSLRSAEEVVTWVQEEGPGVLVIPREVLQNIENLHGSLGLMEFASARRYDYKRGKFWELAVFTRGQ